MNKPNQTQILFFKKTLHLPQVERAHGAVKGNGTEDALCRGKHMPANTVQCYGSTKGRNPSFALNFSALFLKIILQQLKGQPFEMRKEATVF